MQKSNIESLIVQGSFAKLANMRLKKAVNRTVDTAVNRTLKRTVNRECKEKKRKASQENRILCLRPIRWFPVLDQIKESCEGQKNAPAENRTRI